MPQAWGSVVHLICARPYLKKIGSDIVIEITSTEAQKELRFEYPRKANWVSI